MKISRQSGILNRNKGVVSTGRDIRRQGRPDGSVAVTCVPLAEKVRYDDVNILDRFLASSEMTRLPQADSLVFAFYGERGMGFRE